MHHLLFAVPPPPPHTHTNISGFNIVLTSLSHLPVLADWYAHACGFVFTVRWDLELYTILALTSMTWLMRFVNGLSPGQDRGRTQRTYEICGGKCGTTTTPPQALQSIVDVSFHHNTPSRRWPLCQFLIPIIFRSSSTSSVHLLVVLLFSLFLHSGSHYVFSHSFVTHPCSVPTTFIYAIL